MLARTNEYFLRGVAVAFLVKIVATSWIMSEKENVITILLVASIILACQCVAAVFFHSLAIKVGGNGFDLDKKWLTGAAGVLSVHSATFFDELEIIQSLNPVLHILVGIGFVSSIAFW